MKSNRFIYLMLVLVGLAASGCKKDQPDVEYSPVFPISGEWYVHVSNADGTAARATYTTLSTYNTSDNSNNQVWMKMLTSAVPYGLLGKASCDVSAKTISGTDLVNIAFTPNKKFAVLEGKVLVNATTLKSKVVTDSIYVKYSTEADGKTYILSGHRRSQYVVDQY